jgi:hypothetical protein
VLIPNASVQLPGDRARAGSTERATNGNTVIEAGMYIDLKKEEKKKKKSMNREKKRWTWANGFHLL